MSLQFIGLPSFWSCRLHRSYPTCFGLILGLLECVYIYEAPNLFWGYWIGCIFTKSLTCFSVIGMCVYLQSYSNVSRLLECVYIYKAPNLFLGYWNVCIYKAPNLFLGYWNVCIFTKPLTCFSVIGMCVYLQST